MVLAFVTICVVSAVVTVVAIFSPWAVVRFVSAWFMLGCLALAAMFAGIHYGVIR